MILNLIAVHAGKANSAKNSSDQSCVINIGNRPKYGWVRLSKFEKSLYV